MKEVLVLYSRVVKTSDLSSLKAELGGRFIGGLLSMTAQGVGQLHFPSCLIPTLPPPIPVMGVVGHTIDSCITFNKVFFGYPSTESQ